MSTSRPQPEVSAQKSSPAPESKIIFELTPEDQVEVKALQASLKCAISQAPYNEPVVTACCASICNKQALENWVKTHPQSCFCCDKPYTGYQNVALVTNLFNLLGITTPASSNQAESKEVNLIDTLQNLSEETAEAIQAELTCVISGQVFLKPVISNMCAHAYEDESILAYMKNKTIIDCPNCRSQLRPGNLYKIPKIDATLLIINRLIMPLAENLYFSYSEILAALDGNSSDSLRQYARVLVRAFEHVPEHFNAPLDEEMSPAFYFSGLIIGRKILRENPKLRRSLTGGSVNQVSKLYNSEGESILYWLSEEFSETTTPTLADKVVRDLIDPEQLGGKSEVINLGDTILHNIILSGLGQQWIEEDHKFRNKINKISFNNVPSIGVYKKISPLLVMCFVTNLRKVLFSDKDLQKNIGSALNVSCDDTSHLYNKEMSNLSPLLLMTLNFEDDFDILDLLHSPNVRAEISTAGFNKKTKNPQYFGRSPAGQLLLKPKGKQLLGLYSDLRDKYLPETFTHKIDWDCDLKGATLLHACMYDEELFDLFDSFKNLRIKITTLDALLEICDDKNNPLYNKSPLIIILAKGNKGWKFLIKLFKDNHELRSEIIAKFKLPQGLEQNSDLTIALYLYMCFMRLNERTPQQSRELVEYSMILTQKFLVRSIVGFAYEALYKYRTAQITSMLLELIQAEPEILNLSFEGTSFLLLFLHQERGAEFIKDITSTNPNFLDKISSVAWNSVCGHEDLLGLSAFMLLCLHAIRTIDGAILHPKIIHKIQAKTLFTESKCRVLKNDSPLSFLIINYPKEILFKTHDLMRKVAVEDLMSYKKKLDDRLIDYFNYLIGLEKDGVEFIQMRISDDLQFSHAMLTTINEKSILFLQSLGIHFTANYALEEKSTVSESKAEQALTPVQAPGNPLQPLLPTDMVLSNDLLDGITMKELLAINNNAKNNLSVILATGYEGWIFIIQLLHRNQAIRTEFLTKFKLPTNLLDEHNLIVALHIYLRLLNLEGYLPLSNGDMTSHLIKFNINLSVSISQFAVLMMLKASNREALLDKLSIILKMAPHIMNFTNKGISFLSMMFEGGGFYQFILNNPQIWEKISETAWNCYPITGNRIEVTAFFKFCYLAMTFEKSSLDFPSILEKIFSSTLFRESKSETLHPKNSIMDLLIANQCERLLLNNKTLRAKIGLFDLLERTCLPAAGLRISLFDYYRSKPSGLAFIQAQIDDDANFRQDLLSSVSLESLIMLQKQGLFVVRSQEIATSLVPLESKQGHGEEKKMNIIRTGGYQLNAHFGGYGDQQNLGGGEAAAVPLSKHIRRKTQ